MKPNDIFQCNIMLLRCCFHKYNSIIWGNIVLFFHDCMWCFYFLKTISNHTLKMNFSVENVSKYTINWNSWVFLWNNIIGVPNIMVLLQNNLWNKNSKMVYISKLTNLWCNYHECVLRNWLIPIFDFNFNVDPQLWVM